VHPVPSTGMDALTAQRAAQADTLMPFDDREEAVDLMDDQSGADDWVSWAVAAGSRVDTAGLFNTSEIRWFSDGPLPSEVLAWFTGGRTLGSVEDRHDFYQLHRLNDIGVKRRHGSTLEVKVRRTLDAPLDLGSGLDGRIEEWSRWEPAEDDGAWQLPDAPWVDVHKVIYTRSFMPTDREVILPAVHSNRLFAGCDIEVVEVAAGGIDTWSLGLKAFGPTTGRHQALATSWQTLRTHSPMTEGLDFAFDRACGYPEWLRLVLSDSA